MIRMVALDIDGTLLVPGVAVEARPDEAITNAVKALHTAGIVVVLATGRMYPGTAYIAEHLNISQPLICQQGASVHEANGQLRHSYAIDEEVAHELIQYAKDHSWPLSWFDSERYLVTEYTEQAKFFADVSRVNMELHPQPHLCGIKPTGIDIVSSLQHSPEIHRFLEARYGAKVSLLDFPSVTVLHSPKASKGLALSQLAKELNIAKGEVLAIGDSVNDVSMLSWAGHSAAPEHGDQYALESAKEILAGDGIDGVVNKLRSVLC